MLVSVSLILIVGMFMGWLCQKCRLPSLLGMLATGMVLGPYVLNLLDGSILGISPELRKIALIIILTRAGLGLDTSGLKKLGRPAVLMCFVPASFELLGVLLLAPKLMGLSGNPFSLRKISMNSLPVMVSRSIRNAASLSISSLFSRSICNA